MDVFLGKELKCENEQYSIVLDLKWGLEGSDWGLEWRKLAILDGRWALLEALGSLLVFLWAHIAIFELLLLHIRVPQRPGTLTNLKIVMVL